MPDVLHKRCQRDLKQLSRADPASGLPCLLNEWLADAEWVAAAARLPPRERRLRLAEAGAYAFDHDCGGYAEHLRRCTHDLDYLWPAAAREALLRRHCEFLLAALSDTLSFRDASETTVALDEVELSGLDHVRSTTDAGRGMLFLSVHQSHPAFAFKHRQFEGMPISAVANLQRRDGDSLSMLLSGVSDRVRLLPISPAAVRQMLASLKGNEGVAIYADYLYPESGGAASCLFGRPVTVSRSAVAIALRTGAGVVPVAVARRWPLGEGGVDVQFFPPLTLADLDPRDDAAVLRAAARFGVAMEGLIRRFPAQWRLWGTLQYRWVTAASAVRETASQRGTR